MGNFGMVLGVRPTAATAGETIVVTYAGVAPGYTFQPPQLVRVLLHPDTPQLRQVIAGSGRSTGYLVVTVPTANVRSPTEVQFQLPPDVERVAQAIGNGRFLVEVQVGADWAWARDSINVAVAAQPATPNVFGAQGQILDIAPTNVAIGDRVTARVDRMLGGLFSFARRAEVRLYPSSSQLAGMMYGHGASSGLLFVRASQVIVAGPHELSFVIPPDVGVIVTQTGTTQFAVQVDLGTSSAWGRTGITVGRPSSVALPSIPVPAGLSPGAIRTFPVGTTIGSPITTPPGGALPAGTWVGPTAVTPTFVPVSSTAASTPAVMASTKPTRGKPSSSERPYEATVRWVVEALSPIQSKPGDPKDPTLPDVVEAIVSAQLVRQDELLRPMANELVEWELFDPATLPNDDSQILEVATDGTLLIEMFEGRKTPSGETRAYSDKNGKTYCWVRLHLFDRGTLIDPDEQGLKGLKIRIGERREERKESQPAPGLVTGPVLATLTSAMPIAGGLVGGGGMAMVADDWILGWLPDILVDPFAEIVETAVEVYDGLMTARAAIARTNQRVLGWWLKRTADGFILAYLDTVFPDQAAIIERARATYIGFLLGIPRGVWVMGTDQIEDIKMLLSLVPLLIDFIQQNPGTTLTILAEVGDVLGGPPGTALPKLATKLAHRYRDQIRKAIDAFPGAAMRFGPMVIGLWNSQGSLDAGQMLQTFGWQLFDWFYTGFREFVGFIATDYLGYADGSIEYNSFVCGFIAGDFLGYILGTVGLELLLAYATGGIATYVKSIGLIGKLARLGGPIARLVEALFKAYQAVKEAVETAVGVAVDAVKAGIGRVLAGLMHLFEAVFARLASGVATAAHLFVGLIKALAGATADTFSLEKAKRVWITIFKLGDDAVAAQRPVPQLTAIAVGLRAESEQAVADALDALAELVEAGAKVAC